MIKNGLKFGQIKRSTTNWSAYETSTKPAVRNRSKLKQGEIAYNHTRKTHSMVMVNYCDQQ